MSKRHFSVNDLRDP